jgi:hypothetical protein
MKRKGTTTSMIHVANPIQNREKSKTYKLYCRVRFAKLTVTLPPDPKLYLCGGDLPPCI